MKQSKERVVYIISNQLVNKLKKTIDKDDRRKIIKKYLNNHFTGKLIKKSFSNHCLTIKNTKTDTKHLVRNEHLDTSISLTKVEELIEASEYVGETSVNTKEKPRSPNNYFWFFRVKVLYKGKIYEYKLNIGRNKTDGHCGLYDLTNNKKGADSYRISNPGNNTPSKVNITNRNDKVK